MFAVQLTGVEGPHWNIHEEAEDGRSVGLPFAAQARRQEHTQTPRQLPGGSPDGL